MIDDDFLHLWDKPKDGFLLPRRCAKRLVLLDFDEQVIDARYLIEGELVSSGNMIELSYHKILEGDRIFSEVLPQVFREKVIKSQATEVLSQSGKSVSSAPAPSVAPPSINFSRGLSFEKSIFRKFGHPINFRPGPRRREFILVISFARASFRLNHHTVVIVLQGCFGGSASHFRVQLLQDRVFRFSLASKLVGSDIYNAGKISEKGFECLFHLWGEGGPNWRVEVNKFYA